MLMNVRGSLCVTQVPHAPTHLELTRVLATKATLEMEHLAMVGKTIGHNYVRAAPMGIVLFWSYF